MTDVQMTSPQSGSWGAMPGSYSLVRGEKLIGRYTTVSSCELLQVDAGDVVIVSMEFGLFVHCTTRSTELHCRNL